jgi:hypothetical protein
LKGASEEKASAYQQAPFGVLIQALRTEYWCS